MTSQYPPIWSAEDADGSLNARTATSESRQTWSTFRDVERWLRHSPPAQRTITLSPREVVTLRSELRPCPRLSDVPLCTRKYAPAPELSSEKRRFLGNRKRHGAPRVGALRCLGGVWLEAVQKLVREARKRAATSGARQTCSAQTLGRPHCPSLGHHGFP